MSTDAADQLADRALDSSGLSVMFVDDEVENLRVFELAFRRDFKVRTAQSGAEALELLARQPAAVVLSDQRMPGMNGVEFLTRVREFDPDAVRILVTAYGDNETLTDAINQGAIARYVPKPWVPDEMRITIRDGLRSYAKDADRRALLDELAVLNRAAHRLCSELEMTPVLDQLLTLVVDELGFDGATVLLQRGEGEVLEVVRTFPRDSEVPANIEGHTIPMEYAEVLDRVLKGRDVEQVTLGQLFELDAATRDFAAEIAAEDMLLVPLPGRSSGLGVLAVDNRRGGVPFDHANRALLASLGALASIAVDNARLVDDLRHSEELTRRADRLGTLGTLAAGLAHEINNPLVSIQTFLNLAPEKRNVDDPEFWDEYHELACRETDRIRSLVHAMSRLGSDPEPGGQPDSEAVDLAVLAGEAVQLLQASSHPGPVSIELELPEEGVKVLGVRDHLHQVLTNLLLNAIHASSEGGRVVLRVEPAQDGRVVAEVQDWGAGMTPEVLERVFDPFYTTKTPDEGAGLGLMIAHRIVTDHGGEIVVTSGEEEGSTFRVVLPAA